MARSRSWIQAQLEIVEEKVMTLDQAFASHIVLPNDQTLAEEMGAAMPKMLAEGRLPKLLAGPLE